MTFRLPCTDASVNTQLQVFRCPERLHDAVQSDDDDCVLTLASCWDHDDREFMRSKMQLLAKDVFAVATNLMQTECWKNIPGRIMRMRDTGCLCVMGCGHKFSGVPLLYTFMTVGFKCPICRFGDNATIDIDASPPRSLCAETWKVMCCLANVVRKRDKLEKYNEERMLAVQISRQNISMMYRSMPWFIVFALYKENKPTMSSTPYAQIPIKMTVEVLGAADLASGQPEMVKMSAGKTPPACHAAFAVVVERNTRITCFSYAHVYREQGFGKSELVCTDAHQWVVFCRGNCRH